MSWFAAISIKTLRGRNLTSKVSVLMTLDRLLAIEGVCRIEAIMITPGRRIFGVQKKCNKPKAQRDCREQQKNENEQQEALEFQQ